MKRRWYESARRWLVLITLASAVHRASAQWLRQPAPQEPQWFSGHISQVEAGVYTTGTYDSSTFKNSNSSINHTYLFAGPLMGLNLDGSIYHPSLFRYT